MLPSQGNQSTDLQRKELRSSQILYIKHEKYCLHPSIKNLLNTHKVSDFFERKIIAMYLRRRATIDKLSETDN